MNVTIKIKCDNAAFGETDFEQAFELQKAIRRLADNILKCDCVDDCTVMDTNGNRIGEMRVER